MGEIIEIRTLAVRQPWAGFILTGDKPIEYRQWQTPYRVPFLLLGSSRKPTADDLKDVRDEFPRFDRLKNRPCFTLGAVVGGAVLDRISGQEGEWDWHLTHPITLLDPIPAKGKLMLYRSRIDADTPLDSRKHPTIGDFFRAFKK